MNLKFYLSTCVFLRHMLSRADAVQSRAEVSGRTRLCTLCTVQCAGPSTYAYIILPTHKGLGTLQH